MKEEIQHLEFVNPDCCKEKIEKGMIYTLAYIHTTINQQEVPKFLGLGNDWTRNITAIPPLAVFKDLRTSEEFFGKDISKLGVIGRFFYPEGKLKIGDRIKVLYFCSKCDGWGRIKKKKFFISWKGKCKCIPQKS